MILLLSYTDSVVSEVAKVIFEVYWDVVVNTLAMLLMLQTSVFYGNYIPSGGLFTILSKL